MVMQVDCLALLQSKGMEIIISAWMGDQLLDFVDNLANPIHVFGLNIFIRFFIYYIHVIQYILK